MTDSKKVLIVRVPEGLSKPALEDLKHDLEIVLDKTEHKVILVPCENPTEPYDTGLTAALAELAHAITKQCEINQAFLELLVDQVGVQDGDLPGTLDG